MVTNLLNEIENLQEKLEAKTATLHEAKYYVTLSELVQFKTLHFPAMELALWIIVKDLSEKRPAGKKIKNFAEWSDKDIENIFYPVCSKDTLREGMQGVYFDNNFVISTDAHVLLMFADKSKIKRSGNYRFNKIAKELTIDVLVKTESKFPDYINIIPRAIPELQKEIDLSEFYAFLNQFPKWGKIARKNGCECFFYFDRIKIFDGLYNIEFLLKITKALLQAGEKTSRFDFWAKNKAAVLNGTDNMALIMPIGCEGSLEHDWPITY